MSYTIPCEFFLLSQKDNNSHIFEKIFPLTIYKDEQMFYNPL